MSDQIPVLFLSQDLGLADPLFRALGLEFLPTASSEIHLSRTAELRDWDGVVLLDLRSASVRGEPQQALRFIEELGKSSSFPPAVVLCEEADRQTMLDVIERGAYDTVTNPPNMVELRLVLRRAHRARLTEREVERLKTSV